MRSTQGSEADDKARSQASLSQGSMASKASQEHSGSMENVSYKGDNFNRIVPSCLVGKFLICWGLLLKGKNLYQRVNLSLLK